MCLDSKHCQLSSIQYSQFKFKRILEGNVLYHLENASKWLLYQKLVQGAHMIPLKTFIVYIHLQCECNKARENFGLKFVLQARSAQ